MRHNERNETKSDSWLLYVEADLTYRALCRVLIFQKICTKLSPRISIVDGQRQQGSAKFEFRNCGSASHV